ncbi:MAG: hypothetical protein QM608_00720 [Caulobacter sp.]
MGSRRKTGGDRARLPDLTRRSMMGAAAAVPVAAGAASGSGEELLSAADSSLTRCGTFVATDIRISRLVSRWANLEAEVFDIPGWHQLSKEEQLTFPKAQEMARIDAQLVGLFRQRDKLREVLPKAAATTPTEVAAKVAAAVKMVDPEDDEQAHALLVGAVHDLAGMCCPDCRRPLVLEGWIKWSTTAGRE